MNCAVLAHSVVARLHRRSKKIIVPYLGATLVSFTVFLPISACGSFDDLFDALDNKGEKNIPTAKITVHETVGVRSYVTVSAEDSDDPSRGPLTYAWTMGVIPKGSAAALTATETPHTSFYADKGGKYIITLIVTNDQGAASKPTSVVINAVGTNGNYPPVAIIKATLASGGSLLDGTGSYDQDGGRLWYQWTVMNPVGRVWIENGASSVAMLRSTSNQSYIIRLWVSDGIDSDEAYQTVSIQQ